MMKILLNILLILVSISSFAADKDVLKVYPVKAEKTQLKFQSEENKAETTKELWYFAISRHNLNYNIPSFIQAPSDFSNKAIGFTFGKKNNNQFFKYAGFVEYSLEWQNYERSALGPNSISSTEVLNIYKFNLYQNFKVFHDLKKIMFISVGAGISPVFTTVDQSALANSSADLGGLATIKTNFKFPLTHKILNDLSYFAIDVELALSYGQINNAQMTMSSFKLGSNFNW